MLLTRGCMQKYIPQVVANELLWNGPSIVVSTFLTIVTFMGVGGVCL